ncbi:flagellar motor switch protein FliM [Desulfotalea psychrophila]|uniref:Flagellar motor switch protein FliM n=1 Tax=Desulfotalea psychrophila (strain LSv54 / DSM 12343) TaxID=177439 RepID=Q6AJS9_DESPS|nr:FliM/FliN family flagellar motor switch protein [Desulfotalea psychrophila]CAG37397.1 related to flagellar motor switch protein (FliM) [Desulfotalea psychrophila LSv54]
MEPILSKTEIAELLRAIRQGKISLDGGREVNSIDYEKVNLFELTPPVDDKVKIPNFDIIMDSFARHYSILLSNQLQRTISIERIKLESFDFQDVFDKIAHPGAIGMLDLPPLQQGGLILFNPSLSFSLVERLLGASLDLETVCLNRDPTTIELNVLKVIIDHACLGLDKAFSPLVNMNSSLVKIDSKPRLMSITDPDDEVIACTFRVILGKDSGEILLLIPLAALEVLHEDLQHLLRASAKRTTTWQGTIAAEVKKMTADITAQPGRLELSVGDILGLQVGDILEVDYDPSKPLKVLVENSPKFYGIPGTHNGKKAISLTERI